MLEINGDMRSATILLAGRNGRSFPLVPSLTVMSLEFVFEVVNVLRTIDSAHTQ